MDGDDPQYAKDIKGSHKFGKHHEPTRVLNTASGFERFGL